MCYTMSKRHYAVRNKARVFALFDRGKRPSDIRTAPVSRRTLYQYYWEWRMENGIEGKKTGFAVKPFDTKAYLKAKKAEQQKREREPLVRWIKDYEIVLRALKQWAEALKKGEAAVPKVYLPIEKRERWLNQLLSYNAGEMGSDKGWRDRLPMIGRNIGWLEQWIEAARRAADLTEFNELCIESGVGYPSEIDHY